jgi:hypothetical protein
MDPIGVLKSLWTYRWFVLPAILLTLGVAAYVYALGPRSYESTISYALVNPDVPSEADIEREPALAQLNGDNPYLRSTDPNLVANVVITRLKSPATAAYLEDTGLSRDFSVAPGVGGSGFIVEITGVGSTPEQSVGTSAALGEMFERELRTIQEINGADERYLFTSLVVAQADLATEQFSSRLRAVVIVMVGGIVLVFGAVSLGRSIDAVRVRRRLRAESDAELLGEDDHSEGAEVESSGPQTAVADEPSPDGSELVDREMDDESDGYDLDQPGEADRPDEPDSLDDPDADARELELPGARR